MKKKLSGEPEVHALAILLVTLFLKHCSLSVQLQEAALMRNTVKLGQAFKGEFSPIELS